MKPGSSATVNVTHTASQGFAPMSMAHARYQGIDAEGSLMVCLEDRTILECDLLDSLDVRQWQPGERLLVALSTDGERSVVIGKVVTKAVSPVQPTVTIEATESLTLKCGEASVDLRADGKVMVRGEDVLLRAKGTQRIRAGNVAIN